MFEIKDYSIYGSTGFVGSKLIDRHPFNERVNRVQYDCAHPKVIYLISTTHNYHVYDDIALDVKTNLSHLCEVLRKIRDSGREVEFNFISSWFVYGNVPFEDLPVSEEYRCQPQGFYSITKYAAEELVKSFATTFGMKYRILRLPNVLGPGDKGCSSRKNAITWMLHELFSGNQIRLYDAGMPLRDFLHVSDVIDAISIILNKGKFNQVYNVGRGEPTQIGSIIRYAQHRLNLHGNVITVEAPDFHKQVQSKHMWLDASKLFALGFQPRIGITSIVDELLESFQ